MVVAHQFSEFSLKRFSADAIAKYIELAKELAEKVAAEPGKYEIRSRSDMGGSLCLYERTSASPTGVYCRGSVPDLRETRDVLYGSNTTIYMGAC